MSERLSNIDPAAVDLPATRPIDMSHLITDLLRKAALEEEQA